MKTKGALLIEPGSGKGWSVEEIEIDDPKEGEVRVKMAAAGLCHSDQHYVGGDGVLEFAPLLGGHEGAGVVDALGPGVTGFEIGDRVITSFMPACGDCRMCVEGRGHLCDRGAGLISGKALDGTNRVHWNGQPVGQMTYTGTFSPYVVCPADSLIAYGDDVPATVAAIVACAVPTGFGTAVNVAGVRPGDVVAVVGLGGVGISAVQGARVAGAKVIVAVDPVEWKLEQAPIFGATHTAGSIEEATELIASMTNGFMADRVVETIGVMQGEYLDPLMNMVSKGGTVGMAGVSAMTQIDAKIALFPFILMEKALHGGLYGGWDPRRAIPILLDLYRKGELKLDEMITRTYELEQINEAYADMDAGRNIRGVITF